MRRKKELLLNLHGGLGDQLFMYFSAVRIAQIFDRTLILSKWTIDHTHMGSPFGLFEIIPDRTLIEYKCNSLEALFSRIRIRINGLLQDKVNEEIFFCISRFTARRLGIVSNVLNREYEIGEFESVVEDVRSLSTRRRIRLDCYFDDLMIYGQLSANQRELPGLVLNEDYSEFGNNAVVHFRVGDIFETYTSRGVLGLSYYSKCIQQIRLDSPGIRIFGVSDNVDRAKDIFDSLEIEWVSDSDKLDALEILRIFVGAKTLVCANSGLSLWGARLRLTQDKIYIPKFPDKSREEKSFEFLTKPSNWILVENDFLGDQEPYSL